MLSVTASENFCSRRRSVRVRVPSVCGARVAELRRIVCSLLFAVLRCVFTLDCCYSPPQSLTSSSIVRANVVVIMDYQCIVVYTIVRISQFPPYTTEWPKAANDPNASGCLEWMKRQIKRWALILCLLSCLFRSCCVRCRINCVSVCGRLFFFLGIGQRSSHISLYIIMMLYMLTLIEMGQCMLTFHLFTLRYTHLTVQQSFASRYWQYG